MPKRVKSLVSKNIASLENNELFIDIENHNGLGLKYGENGLYEFNGNKPLMAYFNNKQNMGRSNKDISDLHYTDDTRVSITNENSEIKVNLNNAN